MAASIFVGGYHIIITIIKNNSRFYISDYLYQQYYDENSDKNTHI